MASLDEGDVRFLDVGFSTTDFIVEHSKSGLGGIDLTIPTTTPSVLARVATMQASKIFGFDREGLLEAFPDIDTIFKRTLTAAVRRVVGDAPDMIAEQLITAYQLAVEFVSERTTHEFAQGMYWPIALGDMCRYFDMPMSAELVSRLEITNPPLAREYEERTKRWMEGIIPTSGAGMDDYDNE